MSDFGDPLAKALAWYFFIVILIACAVGAAIGYVVSWVFIINAGVS